MVFLCVCVCIDYIVQHKICKLSPILFADTHTSIFFVACIELKGEMRVIRTPVNV